MIKSRAREPEESVNELIIALNSYSFEFLHILQTLVITDDIVKIYRNYVILYTLQDVINELSTCVIGI